jgi:hypothetical protein
MAQLSFMEERNGGVVWCGVVWCGVVWCGVVWCGVVWCGVVWWYSTGNMYSVTNNKTVVVADPKIMKDSHRSPKPGE